MSGDILYLLLGALGVVFWRAWALQSFDQLIVAADPLHHQVLATYKTHPKGGNWVDHKRWMAEG